MTKIKEQIVEFEREYIIFRRPDISIIGFQYQSSDGMYYNPQEINPKDALTQLETQIREEERENLKKVKIGVEEILREPLSFAANNLYTLRDKLEEKIESTNTK